MAYIIIKQIKGRPYLYLVKSERIDGKVKQKVIRYIGRLKCVEKIDDKTLKNIMERDNFNCVRCGETHNLTIDHKKPIIVNGDGFFMVYGDNKEDNLQVLCEKCNRKKSKKKHEHRLICPHCKMSIFENELK